MRQQLHMHLQRVGGVHKEGVQVQGRAGVHTPGGGSPMVGALVRWVRHGSPTRWETRGPPSARVAPVGQGGKSRAGKAAARAPARMSGDLFIR